MFYVISENKILFKGSLNNCVKRVRFLTAKKDIYYYVVNSFEYEHPYNTSKMFNSYFTRFNDVFYDFIEQCSNNSLSFLNYMDDFINRNKTNRQMSIFDFI